MTDTEIVTVHVPFRIRKRGGRKEMILPDAALTQHRHVDNTLIKGLARAFRWKRMLDTGACPTLGDLAASEKISPSYLTRFLRPTLLAPDIIHSILEWPLPSLIPICSCRRIEEFKIGVGGVPSQTNIR